MSFSVEMNEIPQRTIMYVSVGDSMIVLEAWAEDESDKRALETVSKELKEGDLILVEGKEGRSGKKVCGVRRVILLRMNENVEVSRHILALHMILKK